MDEKLWVIWSNEHRAFWRPEHAGYVTKVEDAGRYSFKEALDICKGANLSGDESGYPNPKWERELHEVMCPSPEMIKDMIKNEG